MPMMAPVDHVGALTVEHVTKGRVPLVAGSAKHRELPVYPAREKHTIPVIRQERILHLVESLEIVGVTHAYGGPVVAVTPREVIPVLKPAHTRIVAVNEVADLVVFTPELYPLRLYLPVDAISAHSSMELHNPGRVIAAKYARKTVLKRHDGAIEYAVR